MGQRNSVTIPNKVDPLEDLKQRASLRLCNSIYIDGYIRTRYQPGKTEYVIKVQRLSRLLNMIDVELCSLLVEKGVRHSGFLYMFDPWTTPWEHYEYLY
jgi:hypothetical protein